MMMSSKEIQDSFDVLVPNPVCPLNYQKDYELLLAVMLSAQTTDERVNSVTKELFKYNLKELSNLAPEKIESIIKPVGTQKRKAMYIRKIASILLKESGGRVPHNREFIESLPGCGHKTCNVVFAELFKEPSFAVDTHVARVSKRLGLARKEAQVQEIEENLCKFFPRESWAKLHVQMVLFGRYTCRATKPNCDECPFKNKQCKRDN